MSSGIAEKEEEVEIKIEIHSDLELEYILSQMIISFTNFLDKKHEPDIYTGVEKIPFEQRHPIYKALMRTEFEDEIKNFSKNKKSKE